MTQQKHLFAMFFIDANTEMFQELRLGAVWNVQLRGSIVGSHMALFLLFSVQFEGETHCGISEFQT